ncbi:MAG: hypothetical protein WDO18_13250 [Acidobacteriota bacterium]
MRLAKFGHAAKAILVSFSAAALAAFVYSRTQSLVLAGSWLVVYLLIQAILDLGELPIPRRRAVKAIVVFLTLGIGTLHGATEQATSPTEWSALAILAALYSGPELLLELIDWHHRLVTTSHVLPRGSPPGKTLFTLKEDARVAIVLTTWSHSPATVRLLLESNGAVVKEIGVLTTKGHLELEPMPLITGTYAVVLENLGPFELFARVEVYAQ